MIDFRYDKDAVIQDADAFIAQENSHYRLQKKAMEQGICFHDSWMGLAIDGTIYYPEQSLLKPGQVICTDGCKRIFDTEDDLLEQQRELYLYWTGSY